MSSTVSVISSRKLHAVEKVLVLDGVPYSFSIQPLNEKFKILAAYCFRKKSNMSNSYSKQFLIVFNAMSCVSKDVDVD